ncbi:tyrosine-type recombinase/integrase [Sulfurimonas sp. SWIR-19]|uniref:tyrosine-type recombinase/integrase n=1 Tax=Sulfurimonas sp. SWIR-19 TaxID=2878390 RepID=UPI001CF5F8EA|nr:site-specific integrase [Sulfurimonas sp. SWIR-19]UCN01546.1 tyrosine-type recombinase/integrase [Sulfurimonas sp. SWIR-19]
MLKGDELFQLNTNDLKLAFEYDTEEELRTALELAFKMQVESKITKYKEAKQTIENNQYKPAESLTFEALRDIYITQKRRDGNVTKSTLDDYFNTFKKLTEYFKDKHIHELKIDDIEAFKLHLNTIEIRGKVLSKKTINKHLIYVKQFLKFAMQRDYISKNVAEGVALYNRKQTRKEAPLKENYTIQEIRTILNYKYDDETFKHINTIAIYTGMRLGELYKLTKEDIKEQNGIMYINVEDAKSEAGNRKVPVHKEIETLMKNIQLPFFDGQLSENAFAKKVRYQLYKIVKAEGKNFHTIRGTFVENLLDKNFEENDMKLIAIQQIVGHAGKESDKLTTDTYGKGFKLPKLKKIIDTVSYQ